MCRSIIGYALCYYSCEGSATVLKVKRFEDNFLSMKFCV